MRGVRQRDYGVGALAGRRFKQAVHLARVLNLHRVQPDAERFRRKLRFFDFNSLFGDAGVP